MDPEDEFNRLEAAYVAAINGIDRERGTPAEIKALQQQVLFAQKSCIECGVDVEDVLTVVQRRRKEAEAYVRAYAVDALKVKALIPATKRRAILCAVALASFIAALTLSQGASAFWWSLGGLRDLRSRVVAAVDP